MKPRKRTQGSSLSCRCRFSWVSTATEFCSAEQDRKSSELRKLQEEKFSLE
ncbi:mCG142049, isoform CRA_a [Mus musculus]|nr:mCG142049, isoform CRA_a [Mus musculus]EDL21738.1 mCG142049, isoform CRA_a [Mus musculus]EDL21739.1 mCG142049, isoform CRA_a [Mus musculus]